MRISKTVLATILSLGTAALSAASYSGVNVFLPSIGSGSGFSNSYWETTIWAHNPGSSPANVQFSYLKREQSNLDPQVFNDTIPAGETRRYDNAMQTMFGRNGFGAIRALSDKRLVVNARTYSTPQGGGPEDTVGQFLAAIPSSFALRVGDATSVLGGSQTQPMKDSLFRFNYGLVEAVGGTASVRIRAISEDGEVLAARTYDLSPFEANQWNTTHLGLVDSTNFRIEAEVLSGNGAVIVFGSTMANTSNDPSTFQMVIDPDTVTPSDGIREVEAGLGLTGGGSGESVALHVGQGTGIVVNQDSISLASAIDIALGQVLGPNGGLNVLLSGSGGDPNNGFVSVHDADGYLGGGFFIEDGTYAGSVALYGYNGETNAWIGSSLTSADNGFVGLYGSDGGMRNQHTILDTGEGTSSLYGSNGELNVNFSSNYSDPNSGAMTLRNEYGDSGLLLIVDDADYGVVETYGPNGNLNTMLATADAGPDYGWLGVFDPWGYVQASMYVDYNGYGYVWSSGSYSVWQNSKDSEQAIVYKHPQGPEDTIFLRGKVRLDQGQGFIQLPDHFVVSADMASLSVQLTPHSLNSKGLGVGAIGGAQVEIGELMNGTGSYEVSYFVQAVRSGRHDVPVVTSMDSVRRPGGLIREQSEVGSTETHPKRKDRVAEPQRAATAKLAGTR
ncbi:MAG: hypothetical protein GY906_12290 [bacterium]|nr:hypothetical protein [bacterium]